MIVKTERIAGGRARIDDTRLSVWCLLLYMNTQSDEWILDTWNYITQSDLDDVREYYKNNKEEIDMDIKENSYELTTDKLNSILMPHKADQHFHGVECDSGWNDLILDLHTELLKLDPEYTILQVKEKFGLLRYYFSTQSDRWQEMHDIASIYENNSGKICEICGGEGSLAKLGGWIRTVCDKCFSEAQTSSDCVCVRL